MYTFTHLDYTEKQIIDYEQQQNDNEPNDWRGSEIQIHQN